MNGSEAMNRGRALFLLSAALCAAGCGGAAAVKPAGPAKTAAASKLPKPAKPIEPPKPPEPPSPQRGEVEVRQGKILGADPDGCTWLEGEATVVVGSQDTPHQARAAAIEQARVAAVQDFLGVEIKSKFMNFEQEGLRHEARLTENILETTRSGRILKEEVLEDDYKSSSDCRHCRYYVKLKACVLPRESGADKDFTVELKLSRTRFVHGDPAEITVRATRDCAVYLYDVYDLGAESKSALIVPNEAVSEKTLRAGESWTYPDEAAKKRGVRLEAELPNAGDEVSAETIRVVAAKTPLPKTVYDPADGGYLGVFRRLHRAKVEWTEDKEAFTIYKR